MSTNESHYLKEEVQTELCDIYLQYHKSIKIFITQLETLQNRFPVEILNEIRAVFSHIAKIYVTNNISSVDDNIRKAQGHMRRAQLDAFKYMCYAYLKHYESFKNTYRNVDLSKVNNGDFLIEMSNMYNDAQKKLMVAKEIENTADDTTDSYGAYEEAYYASASLYKLINDNLRNIERLQEKETKEKEDHNRQIEEFRQSNSKLLSEIQKLKHDNELEKKRNKKITVVSILLAITSVVLGIIALK